MAGFANKLRQKTAGYYIGFSGAVLAIVALIIYGVYVSLGGSNQALIYVTVIFGVLLELILFVYDGKFSDALAAIPAILFFIAMGLELNRDYGNIVDKVSNIHMYGDSSLAIYNVLLAAIWVIEAILCIISCGMKRKKQKD